jgi:hypothetical protein
VADRCQICRRVLRPDDGYWCRYCIRSFKEHDVWALQYAAEWAADRARKTERRRQKARAK